VPDEEQSAVDKFLNLSFLRPELPLRSRTCRCILHR
jgi:hypothetical protein